MTRRPGPTARLIVAWFLAVAVLPAVVASDRLAARVHDDVVAAAAVPAPWAWETPADAFTRPRPRLADAHAVPGGHPVQAAMRPVFDRVEAYLAAHAWQARGAWTRLMLLCAWGLWLAPVAFAVVVDGLAARAIKADTFGFQSPAAWAVGRRALAVAAAVPAAALVWPGTLPAAWVAACWVCVLVPLRVALPHLPRVFTD